MADDDFTVEERAYIDSRGSSAAADALRKSYQPDDATERGTKDDTKPENDDTGQDDTDADEGQHRDEKGRYVNHGAFHKERERRRAAENENVTYREKLARAEERLKLLDELIGGQGQQKAADQQKTKSPWDEADIDPNEDVFAALDQQKRRSAWDRQERTREAQERANADRAREERSREDAVINQYRSDATEYAATNSAFAEAYSHLIAGLDKELQINGVSDPSARAKLIAEQERNVVKRAYELKKNPAEVIFSIAEARGFAVKAGNGDGDYDEGKENVNKTDRKPNVESQIERIKRGSKSSSGLSGGGGGRSGELTKAALADMSDDEFAAAYKKLSNDQRARLFG